MELHEGLSYLSRRSAERQRIKVAKLIVYDYDANAEAIADTIARYAGSAADYAILDLDLVDFIDVDNKQLWASWLESEDKQRRDKYALRFARGRTAVSSEVMETIEDALEGCPDSLDSVDSHPDGDRLWELNEMNLAERRFYVSELIEDTTHQEVFALSQRFSLKQHPSHEPTRDNQ